MIDQSPDLEKIKKAHFIGIGGIGVSAIARMLILRGVEVSGSDQSGSEVVDSLRKAGASIYDTHEAFNIPEETEVVVYTIAITETNPEFMEAMRRRIPMMSYPQTLTTMSKRNMTIAVAGTHGKTTTTGMIAHILLGLGKDPTVIVGSLLKVEGKEKSNFIAGKSKIFVVEACEYRGSFLNIVPDIAIILNIEEDHLDYYKDLDEIRAAFLEFCRKIKKDGKLLVDLSLPSVGYVVNLLKKERSDIEIINYCNLTLKSCLSSKLPGMHNQSNAAAACATAAAIGISEEEARIQLATFPGTWRRFEYRGKTKKGVLVYDDYGHHPTEVVATLEGARALYRGNRLVVIFQPHLFSRTKQLLSQFALSFRDADKLIVVPIYAARELVDSTIDHLIFADNVQKTHTVAEVTAANTFDDAVSHVKKEDKANTVCIVMGAGDVYKITDTLITQ